MNYFEDITYVNYGHTTNASSMTEHRFFDGYYGLQYIYSGALSYQAGSRPACLIQNTPVLFITGPGPEFSYGSPPGQYRNHAFICFSGPRVDRWVSGGLLPFSAHPPLLSISNPEYFLQSILDIQKKLSYPDRSMYGKATLLLESLLLELCEQQELPHGIDANYRMKIKNLCSGIVKNPCSSGWDFRGIAARNGISYGYFRYLFQQISGHSPSQFLLECRLKHAEQLLISTGSRIKEIAYACCFNDEFHFSKIFKKHRGLAPLAYRRKYSQI